MTTIWVWLAAANGRDTNNHDLRNALAAQGYNQDSTFDQLANVKATLEPLLVAANNVTVAMVGGLFAEVDRRGMAYVVFFFFSVYQLVLFLFSIICCCHWILLMKYLLHFGNIGEFAKYGNVNVNGNVVFV